MYDILENLENHLIAVFIIFAKNYICVVLEFVVHGADLILNET